MRYKSILYFILLNLFLWPPFIIRSVDPRLEIFPSIVLPSYASLVKMNKEETIYLKRPYAYVKNGSLKEVDKAKFFEGIHGNYSAYIIANHFGLDTTQIKKQYTGRFKIPYTVKSKVTEQERAETKIWIRNRLANMGYNDSILVIATKKIDVSKNRTFLIHKTIENDTVIRLY